MIENYPKKSKIKMNNNILVGRGQKCKIPKGLEFPGSLHC